MSNYQSDQFMKELDLIHHEFKIPLSYLAAFLDLNKNSLYILRRPNPTWTPTEKWYRNRSQRLQYIRQLLEEYRNYHVRETSYYKFDRQKFLTFVFLIYCGLRPLPNPLPELVEEEEDSLQAELRELLKPLNDPKFGLGF